MDSLHYSLALYDKCREIASFKVFHFTFIRKVLKLMMHLWARCAIRCHKQARDIYDAEVKFITYSRAHVICNGPIYTLHRYGTLRCTMLVSHKADSLQYYHILRLWWYILFWQCTPGLPRTHICTLIFNLISHVVYYALFSVFIISKEKYLAL